MDKDGTGLITPQEVKQFFDENDQIDIDESEVKELIQELDYAGNGMINYSEFLAATIDTQTFFNDARFRAVFSMFDVKGTNQITADEMYIAFQKLGQEVPKAKVKELIAKHDTTNSDSITYEEFKEIFLKN
jgi:calcium-dependent protein kinase